MEIEIKLLLDSGGAERLRRSLPPPSRVIRQRNRYYDDVGRSLAREGWGLRLREEREKGVKARAILTLKHSGEEVGEFSHRPEFETTVDGGSSDPPALLAIARSLLPDPGELPDADVREIGEMINHREVYALEGFDAAVLELDHTVWPDGSESDELEMELASPGEADAARARLRQLLEGAGVPWRVGRESKLQRLIRILADRD